MQSGFNPLFLDDTFQQILLHLSKRDLQAAKLVNKRWQYMGVQQFFLVELGISLQKYRSIKNPLLVAQRLQQFLKQAKIKDTEQSDIFNAVSVNGTLPDNFVRLFDVDLNWYSQYFANMHAYGLAIHLKNACVFGNIELVKFLVENKGCSLTESHVYCAAASGSLDLLIFIIEAKNCTVSDPNDLFVQAASSGNCELLQYVYKKNNIDLDKIKSLLIRQSLGMIKHLNENNFLNKQDLTNYFSTNNVINLISLEAIEYIIKVMKWQPAPISYFNYLENKNIFIPAATVLRRMIFQLGRPDLHSFTEKHFPSGDQIDENDLHAVLKSGSGEMFDYFISKYKISAEMIQKMENDQYTLLITLLGGNLKIAKYLLERCSFNPKREDLLHYAVRSTNTALVDYFLNRYNQYKASLDDLKLTHNLNMLSYLWKKIDSIDLSKLYKEKSYSNLLYHLMETKGAIPDRSLLEKVFKKYKELMEQLKVKSTFGVKEALTHNLLFMDYLITVYQLKPRVEMRKYAKLNNDESLKAIFAKWQKPESFATPSFKLKK